MTTLLPVDFPAEGDFKTHTAILEAILTKYLHDLASPMILLQFAYEDMNKLHKARPVSPEELTEFLIQIEWISKSIAAMRKELHYLTEKSVVEPEQSISLKTIFEDLQKNLPYNPSKIVFTIPELPNVLVHPDTFLLALQSLLAFFQRKSPENRIEPLSVTVSYSEEEKMGKLVVLDPHVYLEPAILEQYESPFKHAHENLHGIYHLIVTNRFLNRDGLWMAITSEKAVGTCAVIELGRRNFG